MMEKASFIFKNKPIGIAAIIGSIAILLVLVLNAQELTKSWTWKIVAASLLFYSVLNAILSLKQKKFKQFILSTIAAYLVLFFGLITLVWSLCGNMPELEVYFKIIYPCLLVFFFMLLGLAFLMRGMLRFVSGENPSDFF